MMSEQDFDLKLRHIEEQHAARREGADAYRDQEMARLFEECGWTQEKIAGRMGKRQSWVSYRLKFGAFLKFITGCDNRIEGVASLTEGRFRDHWKRTKGKEQDRFEQVRQFLEHGIPHGHDARVNKPGIRKATIEGMMDSQWYTVSQITATIEESLPGVVEEQVRDCMTQLRKNPPHGMQMQVKKIGNKCQYRLSKAKQPQANPSEQNIINLYEEALPLIEELRHWGNTHRAQMAPGEILKIAVKLERLFEQRLAKAKA